MLIPNPDISIKVIFEDDDILVIDKPAGIPCLPVKEGETGTAANGIAAHIWNNRPRPAINSDKFEVLCSQFINEAGILHRLDNDTSGCLLVAKNAEAYDDLRAQFDEEKILKKYTALVLGEMPQEGVIDTPVIHDPKDKKRMKVVPLTLTLSLKGRGKLQPASTSYKLVKKFIGGRYSLLEVTITTGVRHQIRVHMASIGHPLAGDRLYQNARQRELDRTGLTHQFLHASRLGLFHPGGGKWVEFTCDLPGELRNVLTNIATPC
jgi:23S rRNA pseudouridine1911/1915/1917 synthase